jgi:hypothetical protein
MGTHRGVHGRLAPLLRLPPAIVLIVYDKVPVAVVATGESVAGGLLRCLVPRLEQTVSVILESPVPIS